MKTPIHLKLTVDRAALDALCHEMVVGDVFVTLTHYPVSGLGGRYVGMRDGVHRIALERRQSRTSANWVLCHELGHAAQCEHIGSVKKFEALWWREMRTAGLKRADITSGAADNRAYRTTPLEAEANEFADLWFPRCAELGYVVRVRDCG